MNPLFLSFPINMPIFLKFTIHIYCYAIFECHQICHKNIFLKRVYFQFLLLADGHLGSILGNENFAWGYFDLMYDANLYLTDHHGEKTLVSCITSVKLVDIRGVFFSCTGQCNPICLYSEVSPMYVVYKYREILYR